MDAMRRELGPVPKLAAFSIGLVAAFGAAFGIGRVVGPIGSEPAAPPPPAQTTTTMVDHGTHP